jgi:AraC-like DNA-binding protein
MQAARTVQGFIRAPLGKYLLGRNHLWWCHSATLAGSLHWGRFGAEDLLQFLQAVDFADGPDVHPPLDIITDASRAEVPDPAAFRDIHEHVRQHVDRFSRFVRRQAIVHAGGLSGAAVAGFLPTLGIHYQWESFRTLADAFAWLGDRDAPAVLAEVEAMAREVLGVPPATAAVRDYLERQRELKGATLRAAGRFIGNSARSLQRRLAAEGTSFRAELARARVRAATPLLLDGTAKLEAIARTVGCSSQTALTRLFRRLTGETPLQLRARRRAGQ